MATTLQIKVRCRWWFRPYLTGVVFAAWLTGLEPDLDKVGKVVQRGIKIEFKPVR